MRLESKVNASFISLIIRNEIYKSLKPLYLKNRKEYLEFENEVTPLLSAGK